MTKTEIHLTDPSRELAILAEHLRKLPGLNESEHAYVAIARAMEVHPDSADYLEAAAEVLLRLKALAEFARQVTDPDIDDELRQDVVSATTHLAHLFTPSYCFMSWKEAKQRFIQESHLRILKWFGPTARRYKPLRMIQAEDAERVQNTIVDLIKEIQDKEPHWSNAPLINGLQRLQRTLKYLIFFGHEAVIDQIILFSHRVIAIKEETREEGTDGERYLPSILKVLNVIALIGALLCLPDQIVSSVSRYHQWSLNQIIQLLESHSELRLLPAPGKIPSSEPSTELLDATDTASDDAVPPLKD